MENWNQWNFEFDKDKSFIIIKKIPYNIAYQATYEYNKNILDEHDKEKLIKGLNKILLTENILNITKNIDLIVTTIHDYLFNERTESICKYTQIKDESMIGKSKYVTFNKIYEDNINLDIKLKLL